MSATRRFQSAVRAVIDGEEDVLGSILKEDPTIVGQRAQAEHGATLLHYLAANGVEDELQRCPSNGPDIAKLLLAQGAEPDAYFTAYGRPATTLEMLVSSFLPFETGTQEALVRVLVGGGAHPEGPACDGKPLTTALVFGYTRSAETLAEMGANGTHLFAAAGLGYVGQVDDWFTNEGTLRKGALEGYVPLRPNESQRHQNVTEKEIVQEAFHFAVTHGRKNVARSLLLRGANTNGRVAGHHCELPLLQTLFVHEVEMARWLLQHGADPNLRDSKRKISAREHVERFGPQAARTFLEPP